MYQLYRVDEALCTGCGACVDACPAEAIALVDGRARIDDAACIDCGSCAGACPQGAIMLADAAGPAYPVIQPQASLTVVAPVKTSTEVASLVHRPNVEAPVLSEVARLPAEPQRSRFWPLIGGALTWAARELLPEVLAAWRTSRAGVVRPISSKSVASGQVASKQLRAGRRHRWGRA